MTAGARARTARGRAARAATTACLVAGSALGLSPSAYAGSRVEPCIWPDTGTNLQVHLPVHPHFNVVAKA